MTILCLLDPNVASGRAAMASWCRDGRGTMVRERAELASVERQGFREACVAVCGRRASSSKRVQVKSLFAAFESRSAIKRRARFSQHPASARFWCASIRRHRVRHVSIHTVPQRASHTRFAHFARFRSVPVAVDRRTGPCADGRAALRCIGVGQFVEVKYVGYVVTGSRT